MKILIFSTAYWPHIGGAEVAVKEITDRINDVKFDMITVRLDKKDLKREKVGNISVYRIGFGLGRIDKLLFPFRAARLGHRLNQQNQYHIAWSIMASFSGLAALFFKKKHPAVKFLLTLQEGDNLARIEKRTRFIKKWFKQIFTTADHVQVISKYLANWAVGMGASNDKITIVHNGTCLSQVSEAEKEELRKKLGIRNDKIVLTTSRLVEKNGLEYLIKAMEKLPAKLIICGTGELKNKLEQVVKDLKIRDKVVFAGFIQPTELFSYYAIADVFCRPSISEGLGNSFLEAMGAGVPVVGTPVGGIVDFLEDRRTGWFCKEKNKDSIFAKLKYILDEKNKIEVIKVINSARQMVLEKYNWDKISLQMKDIFNKLA